ncbi:MAG: YdbL family protein [Woeseiaceae bacterium]|nr:YdbL family protein [Woeseiaceae bacterium]
MNKVTIAVTTLLATFVAACVTINVYFPEAAAVEAADRIIDKVRGESDDSGTSLYQREDSGEPSVMVAFASSVIGFLVSDANAQDQIDFDKPSPEKQALEQSLAQRFPSLKPYFDSGAIGVTDSSLIDFRDRNLVPLKDRNTVVQLVAAQNNDWLALYAEIAKINKHPEWQDGIRRTFAERWIAKANKGWYYREGGTWKQK